MNANERELLDGELVGRVVGVFYDVYTELGYGFLETELSPCLGR
jgi:hypothetical protein